mmetsp:Transcript_32076/g.53620  ORF Transcript_32076/g.53620 Transcript_32076/m.53620 type:complete len:260 (-) Transcript_32076:1866-2645(-)
MIEAKNPWSPAAVFIARADPAVAILSSPPSRSPSSSSKSSSSPKLNVLGTGPPPPPVPATRACLDCFCFCFCRCCRQSVRISNGPSQMSTTKRRSTMSTRSAVQSGDVVAHGSRTFRGSFSLPGDPIDPAPPPPPCCCSFVSEVRGEGGEKGSFNSIISWSTASLRIRSGAAPSTSPFSTKSPVTPGLVVLVALVLALAVVVVVVVELVAEEEESAVGAGAETQSTEKAISARVDSRQACVRGSAGLMRASRSSTVRCS